ncbi:hypothetical protein SPI_09017 [Niveomyces insectorum RCEF 264]|uniref:Uncharacterized protein n=1 Tax=Niveomyces insectorum RCEF 264 TaxID=1081102 RepID=A0A167M938_9HYPO|nr:hypothetical protein SPI_09017 [Niveomyces insectorum RCEF 264]
MAVCASCRDPLVFLDDVDEDVPDAGGEAVPDDLLLPSANQPAVSSSSSSSPPATGIRILTRYVSEGGLQDNYDIYPDVAEEAYLLAHPEARPARAFLIMCAGGDVMGLVTLLSELEKQGDEEEEEKEDTGESSPRLSSADLLRYQDPLNGLQSGLHVAVDNNQEEVFYLLLFLASRLPLESFPPAVLESAQQIGLVRPDAAIATYPDIRSLHDQRGETAEAYALRKGGQWTGLAHTGIFTRS